VNDRWKLLQFNTCFMFMKLINSRLVLYRHAFAVCDKETSFRASDSELTENESGKLGRCLYLRQNWRLQTTNATAMRLNPQVPARDGNPRAVSGLQSPPEKEEGAPRRLSFAISKIPAIAAPPAG